MKTCRHCLSLGWQPACYVFSNVSFFLSRTYQLMRATSWAPSATWMWAARILFVVKFFKMYSFYTTFLGWIFFNSDMTFFLGCRGPSASTALRLSILRETRPLTDEGVLRVGNARKPSLSHCTRLHHHRLQRKSCIQLQSLLACHPAGGAFTLTVLHLLRPPLSCHIQIRIWLHIPAVMQHIIPFRTYVIRWAQRNTF